MITKSMTMMLAGALLAGCAAQTDDTSGGGGGDGGNGNDGSPGAYFIDSTIRDERGDAITFTADGPVHAHAGASVTLGATGCPAVYKHAYLLDQTAPRYGRETTPNPLAWKLELEGVEQLDLASSTYRVRTSSDEIVLDWTKIPARDGDTLTIPLYRSGDVPIPALGQHAGELHVDVRTVTVDGAEQVVSACWDHQPLAAPLELEQPGPVSPGLATTTFAGIGPATMATVVTGTQNTPVLGIRITQHTSERVQLALDVATPSATYTSRIVDDFVESQRQPSGTTYSCGVDDPLVPNDDPRCDESPLADPADVARAGALANTTWSATVIHAATGTVVSECTSSADLRVRCELPPRAADAPAHTYYVGVAATSFRELFPASTAIDLRSVADHYYVGAARTGTSRCNTMRVRQLADGTFVKFCISWVDYARIFALDQAKVTIEPVSFAVQAAPAASVPLVPLATLATAPFVWDTGNADLPGPQ